MFTTEQRIFMVVAFFSHQESMVRTQRAYRASFGTVVSTLSIRQMIAKFREHGTVLNRWKGNSGRRRMVRTEEHQRQVAELINAGDTTSLRKIASDHYRKNVTRRRSVFFQTDRLSLTRESVRWRISVIRLFGEFFEKTLKHARITLRFCIGCPLKIWSTEWTARISY